MKNIVTLVVMAALIAASIIWAAESPKDAQQAAKLPPASNSPAEAVPPKTADATPAPVPTNPPEAPPAQAAADTNATFHLDFRDVPLETVLDYFSREAGFAINVRLGVTMAAKVNLWNARPLTKDDALTALQTVLHDNGLAYIRNGQTLTILNRENAISLNFDNAPLDQVLKYLSEAAGFTVSVKPSAMVRGKRIKLMSDRTLTRDEAIRLLDSALSQNDLAASYNDHVLTIVNKDEAKTQNIPVISEADPDKIPITDRVVTQIIPVRFVEVGQLAKDLQQQVSSQVIITANEAGNAIVITDTQAVIHRVAEIIKDIDAGAEDVTVVQLFTLHNADATETAAELTSLFSGDTTQTGQSQTPFQFGGGGGPGGFFRRMMGGGGGGPGGGQGNNSSGANSQNQRIKKRARVVAVADARTQQVMVTATKDLMEQVKALVEGLDAEEANKKTAFVIPLQHADPQETLQSLQDTFGPQRTGTSTGRGGASQTSALTGRSTTQYQQNSTSTASRSSFMQGQGQRIGQ